MSAAFVAHPSLFYSCLRSFIGLPETYKMIDACDPKIAGWSADGTSFLVRDTDRLAKVTIPQYFKHNKWSSFVRQLNFYGFKKVKSEAVTLEEEEQLEGTVRFRHDSFLRGRPDLLMEIHRKKMAADGKAKQLKRAAGAAAATGPMAGGSGGSNGAPAWLGVTDAASKSEVNALRDRIAAMSQNIDDLSAMVQNMQVRDAGAATAESMSEYGNVGAGTKRKKVGVFASAHASVLPESVGSSSEMMMIDDELPDVAPEGVKSFDQSIAFTPGNIFPSVSSVGAASCSRQASLAGSDGAFVDDLFAFNEEGLLDGPTEDEPMATEEKMGATVQPENAGPDPKLMKELTDALTLLPKEMQDTLVNRMISTIVGTGPDSLRSQLNSTGASPVASASASVASSRAASPKPRAIVESDEKVATPADSMERKTVVVAASPDKNDDTKSEIAIQIDSAMFNSLVKHLAKTQGAAGKTDKILPPSVAVH